MHSANSLTNMGKSKDRQKKGHSHKNEGLKNMTTEEACIAYLENKRGFKIDEHLGTLLDDYNHLKLPQTFLLDDTSYEVHEQIKAHIGMIYGSGKKPIAEIEEGFRALLAELNEKFPLHLVCKKAKKEEPPPPSPTQAEASISAAKKRKTSVSKETMSEVDSDETHLTDENMETASHCALPDSLPGSTLDLHDEPEKSEDPQVETENKVTTAKPKPLMVRGLKPSELKDFSQTLINAGNQNFELKYAGLYTRLFPSTLQDKQEFIEILKANRNDFYIVPDRHNPVKVVIGGLEGLPENEIKEALIDLNYDVIDLKQMKSRRDGKPLPLFLAQLVRNKHSKGILSLKTLFKIRIKVQPFRATKKATQCYRCQGFFHVASNCHVAPQCAAGCTDEHETRDCPLKNLEEEKRPPPRCCNCNGVHPSGFKGCDAFPDRKSYAAAAKGSNARNATSEKKPKSKAPPSNQSEPKKQPNSQYENSRRQAPPTHNSRPKKEELQDFTAGMTKLCDVIKKLKTELGVSSFSNLADSLEAVLHSITKSEDQTRKKLQFLDAIDKMSSENSMDTHD